MAIAPIVDGKPDYKNTAVVYAGTNVPPIDTGATGLGSAIDSAFPGYISYEFHPAARFLQQTHGIVEENGGRITDVSGFSQSGGYLLKLTAIYGPEYGFRGTSFDDWGSIQDNNISPSEHRWLTQNPDRLIRYRYDSFADLSARDDKYGTIIHLTRTAHNGEHAKYFDGDALSLDRLAKDGIFAPGMSEAQVKLAAKKWAKDNPDPAGMVHGSQWVDLRIQQYVKQYGSYGTGKFRAVGFSGSGQISVDTAFALSGPELINQVITQLRTIQARNDAIPEQLRTAHKTALDVSVAAFSMLTTQYDIEAEVHRRGDLPENHMNVGEIERVHTEIENEIAELEQLKSVLTQVVKAREERDRVDAASFGF